MLRLRLLQETSHFRIPTVGNPYLTYFLPPPSTVYGFLRKVTDYESINYKNTQLSIQGKFTGISFEKEQLILQTQKETKTNIISIQKLHNVTWIIHIKSSEEYERKIYSSFKNPNCILRFGRTEDLIIDYDIEKVEEKEVKNKDNIEDDYKYFFIYRKLNSDKKLKGQIFRLFVDSNVDEKLNIIDYEPIKLIYASIYEAKEELNKYDGIYFISWIP